MCRIPSIVLLSVLLLPIQAAMVPASYSDLATLIEGKVADFETLLSDRWDGKKSPVRFSAELHGSSSHRGFVLLQAGSYNGMLLEMQRMQELGATSVTVSISYPVLSQRYYDDFLKPANDLRTAFITLYRQLVDDAHARGLKVYVDTNALFTTGGFSDPAFRAGEFYATLTTAQYLADRALMLETIATQIKPDWVVIGAEPDTEQAQTGKLVNSPTVYRSLVDQVMARWTSAGITDVRVGVGIGVWNPEWQAFLTRYLASAVHFIDLHSYPVNHDFLPRLLTIADQVAASGKGLTVGECWAYKARDSELTSIAAQAELFARDRWSFWQPYDLAFMRAMTRFAHATDCEVLSFFWSRYFSAQLDYDAVKDKTLTEQQSMFDHANAAALVAGTHTGTGAGFTALCDGTSPSKPTGLQARPMSTQVELTWNAASDAVGVTGYRVSRDGVDLSEVTARSFTDTGLAIDTVYTYSVVAVDGGFNHSAPATVTTRTTAAGGGAPSSGGGGGGGGCGIGNGLAALVVLGAFAWPSRRSVPRKTG